MTVAMTVARTGAVSNPPTRQRGSPVALASRPQSYGLPAPGLPGVTPNQHQGAIDLSPRAAYPHGDVTKGLDVKAGGGVARRVAGAPACSSLGVGHAAQRRLHRFPSVNGG